MTADSNDSQETRGLLIRFIGVTVLTPIVLGGLAYLGFHYLGWEYNAGNIRRSILVIWLGTMFALGVSLFLHLRARPRTEYRRHVVSRMDWEHRSNTKTVGDASKAFISIPLLTVVYLLLYHFFWEPFASAHEFKTLVAVLLPLWLLSAAVIAARTRRRRLG